MGNDVNHLKTIYRLTDVLKDEIVFETSVNGDISHVTMPTEKIEPNKQYRLDVWYISDNPEIVKMQPDGQLASVIFTTSNKLIPNIDQLDLSKYVKKDDLEDLLAGMELSKYLTKNEISKLITETIAKYGGNIGGGGTNESVYNKNEIDAIVRTINHRIDNITVSDTENKYLKKTETATNSDKLGGINAVEYVTKKDVNTIEERLKKIATGSGSDGIAEDSKKLGGIPASEYLKVGEKVSNSVDSDTLGGVGADKYALKTDLAGIEGGSSLFTTSSPITNPVGGFKVGEEYKEEDNITMLQAFNKLLHKYIPPNTDIKISPSEKMHEKGTEVPYIDIVATVTKGTSNLIKSEIIVNGVTLASSTESLGDRLTCRLRNINVNQHISLSVKDSTQSTNTNINIIFVHRQYFGKIESSDSITPELIKKLNNSRLADTRRFQYKDISLNNERIVYAYPSTYGNLTSIKDRNNFEYIGDYEFKVLSLSGVDYNCYILKNSVSGSSIQMTFK